MADTFEVLRGDGTPAAANAIHNSSRMVPEPGGVAHPTESPVPPYRVLLTCDFFEPGFRAGGPVRSVAQLLDTVSPSIEVTMVTRDRDLGSTEPYPGLSGHWARRGPARIYYLDPGRLRQWYALLKTLRSSPFDLLYVNSLWAMSSILPILAAITRIIRVERILVAPRGELAASALGVKSRKKRLFLSVWRPILRRRRVQWHATNPHEAQLIRDLFPWARIETRRNEVSLPAEPIPPADNGGSPRLVFIGRINPIKNLAKVIEALTLVTRPVVFDVYGPIEDRPYWAECQLLAQRLPASVTFSYRGELAHQAVRSTFARYDMFVFPTQGENFGHVIAESLSASCPVICSDETPWSPVLRAGGGVVLTDATVATLAHQIDQFAQRGQEERLAARRAAGQAYRSWRAETAGPNILDRIRLTVAER
ncbi:glycosyltransferase involved in cell wall biosynthesis [Micromonospora violae]|uniref:Glycosyltransferase involved in cell wall biosynthesis n=1 Tax=Micromonospora violae TaxID=1278207 RepID=A0A4V2FNN7_9ACTN|nr:glycosyltransferase family 4 protein [Micromonospora violae]RZT77490.1 glycosyltransferase involved in cell wall biosynthesis [Micromonospora violae]